MTALMIYVTLSTDPLLGGLIEFFERKKWPPTRLQALDSDRSEALLCPASTIFLAEKVMIASG